MNVLKNLTLILLLLLCITGCKKEESPDFNFQQWYGYSSERYLIKKYDKWGFIDRAGDIVIDPQFEYSAYFINSVAVIQGPDNDSVIDENGYTILKPANYTIGNFSREGIAPVRDNSGSGYIDLEGNLVVPLVYESTWSLFDGYGPVLSQSKYGYVNTTGEEVIECQFAKAGAFNNGMAAVGDGEKYGYINTKGELVVPYQYSDAYMFTENLAGVSNGEKMGFIDLSGALVIDYQYDWIWSFTEGLAAVQKDGEWGYIDHEGAWVIEPGFASARHFSEGLSVVKDGDLYGFINMKGDYTIEPLFRSAYSFVNGLAHVHFENGPEAYINKQGNIVYEFTEKYGKKSAASDVVFSKSVEEELMDYIFRKQSLKGEWK